ncbi:MAG: hypothetical protein H6669_13190 [Ardenticatenaceae bacterium]|nr:hypothetical protein [Ardenticatenaceae bacterium]
MPIDSRLKREPSADPALLDEVANRETSPPAAQPVERFLNLPAECSSRHAQISVTFLFMARRSLLPYFIAVLVTSAIWM